MDIHLIYYQIWNKFNNKLNGYLLCKEYPIYYIMDIHLIYYQIWNKFNNKLNGYLLCKEYPIYYVRNTLFII